MKNIIFKLFVMTLLLTAGITNIKAQDDNVSSSEVAALRQELEDVRNKMHEDSLNNAQRWRDEKIWGKKSSPMMILYGSQSLQDENSPLKLKSDLAFGFSKRRTYYLHSKPIAGMVKIGLDVTWFETYIARYAKGKGISLGNMMGNITSGTYDNYDDYFNAADKAALNEEEVGNLSGLMNSIDVGKWQGNFSMLGIGPSVKVVPFYALNKSALDKLKVTAYFHYVPTYTVFLRTGDEDTSASGGYLGQMRYGLNLSFGRIGIGVEHQWGKGKLTNYDFDEDDENSENEFDITTKKSTYKTSSTRFYIGIKF